MKKHILIGAGLVLLFFSCTKREDRIPEVLDGLSKALNSADGNKFKSYISESAEDYNSIDDNWVSAMTETETTNKDGSTNLIKFHYNFKSYDIPDSGRDILVKAQTKISVSVKLKSDTTSAVSIPIDENGKTQVQMVEEDGFLMFNTDWKVKKLDLPVAGTDTRINVLKQKDMEIYITALKAASLQYSTRLK